MGTMKFTTNKTKTNAVRPAAKGFVSAEASDAIPLLLVGASPGSEPDMGPSDEPGILDPPASCAGPGAGAGANIDSLATVGGAISGGICCDPVAL